jgi:hypothetical protein
MVSVLSSTWVPRKGDVPQSKWSRKQKPNHRQKEGQVYESSSHAPEIVPGDHG